MCLNAQQRTFLILDWVLSVILRSLMNTALSWTSWLSLFVCFYPGISLFPHCSGDRGSPRCKEGGNRKRNLKDREVWIQGGRVHRGYMWVCISMPSAARRHRPSLMKYFCSQSSNRGYSPFTSLALIRLSPLCLFSLSSCNSLRPSGLSSLSHFVLSIYLIFPPFTFSLRLCCSPPSLCLAFQCSASLHICIITFMCIQFPCRTFSQPAFITI